LVAALNDCSGAEWMKLIFSKFEHARSEKATLCKPLNALQGAYVGSYNTKTKRKSIKLVKFH
jgi:hypothetical protein